MGGLPRRATFIDQQTEDGVPALILDSGNIFADKQASDASLATIIPKAELLLTAMEKMGYRAAALGEKDLYLGKDNLERLADFSSVTLISANLMDKDGKPLFDPYIIIKTGDIKVGVLGLTSPYVHKVTFEERMPGYKLNDPIVTASRIVPEIRKKSDLVIALTNMGFSMDGDLARNVPGIDLIIGGRSRRFMKEPAEINGTLVTSGYYQGRAVGVITLGAKGINSRWMSGKKLDFMKRQIETAEANAGTKRAISNEEMGRLKEKFREALTRTRFDSDMINLDPSIKDHPEVAKMIKQYRQKLVLTARGSGEGSKGHLPGGYVGYTTCLKCHQGRYLFWKTTGHARAIESLLPKNAGADPDCLPCHVTAYRPGSNPEELTGVQCEACHGSGDLHSSSPGTYSLVKSPPASVCLVCHTPEQDDDFAYVTDKSLICAESK